MLVAQVLKNEEDSLRWSELPMQVAKFTAIIRLADALDRSAKQKTADYRVRVDDARHLVVSTQYKGDMTLEKLSFERNKAFFGEIFGIEPEFRQQRSV